MSIVALYCFFIFFADTRGMLTEPSTDTMQLKYTAEVAIKSAEESLSKSSSRSILNERLLDTAKRAYSEGRFEDAIAIARRIQLSVVRRGNTDRVTTKPAVPAIDSLYEAMERFYAAEKRYGEYYLISTVRELIANAEALLEAGRITQADQLSKRAILMLYALPPIDTGKIESDTKQLDINKATLSQLLSVPGITEEMAKNLIWFRRYIGELKEIEELRYVPGFDTSFLPIARRYFVVE